MAELVRLNMQGRVHFVDGIEEVTPGISLHYVGGHTAGIQVARVNTKKGQASWRRMRRTCSGTSKKIRLRT